jgi:hypothetical protein
MGDGVSEPLQELRRDLLGQTLSDDDLEPGLEIEAPQTPGTVLEMGTDDDCHGLVDLAVEILIEMG